MCHYSMCRLCWASLYVTTACAGIAGQAYMSLQYVQELLGKPICHYSMCRNCWASLYVTTVCAGLPRNSCMYHHSMCHLTCRSQEGLSWRRSIIGLTAAVLSISDCPVPESPPNMQLALSHHRMCSWRSVTPAQADMCSCL